MTQRPIRLAMAGAGVFARDSHLPALRKLSDRFEIAAVYSRTAESAAQLNALLDSPVPAYTDFEELLARQDIEAVDIALPIHVMPAAVEAALAAGKHVISEKPVAPTVAAGRRLLDAQARHPGPVWMVAENYRYEEPFQRAAEIVRGGQIGRPFLADWAIYVAMRPGNKFFHTDWRQIPAHQGGFLLDGGVHHVAGLRMVLGEVAVVNSLVALHQPDLPPVDTLSASLRFASGALASYSVTYAAGAPWYGVLQVVGERGALRINRSGTLELTVDGQTETITVPGFTGIEGEFAAFAAAIRDGAPPSSTPLEALRDVAVVEAMLRSGATGQRTAPESIPD